MDKRKQAVKKYNKLQKKYKLPKLEELEKNTDMCFEKPYFYLNDILSGIAKRFSGMMHHAMGLMQPKTIVYMLESNFIDDSEKKEIMEFGEKCMKILRQMNAAVYSDDKEKAKMINKGYEFYVKELKPYAHKFLTKLAKEWGEKETKEEIQNYFG